jgi:hypothetical protein
MAYNWRQVHWVPDLWGGTVVGVHGNSGVLVYFWPEGRGGYVDPSLTVFFLLTVDYFITFQSETLKFSFVDSSLTALLTVDYFITFQSETLKFSFVDSSLTACVCVCVLSHWVHAGIGEVPDLPTLKCSSHWSLGLHTASVDVSPTTLIVQQGQTLPQFVWSLRPLLLCKLWIISLRFKAKL